MSAAFLLSAVLAVSPVAGAPATGGPEAIADGLATTSRALDEAIDRWRAEGDPARGGAPDDVVRLAYEEQRVSRRLARDVRLYGAVMRNVRGPLRAELRDDVRARRALERITSVKVGPTPRIRIGAAQPVDVLRRHYRRAWRRFGVGPPLLAAVNYVESAFGRLRNNSVSGAQGPMQFIPSTWAAYGLGGDIRDPRDAILGAANYLHANGAPGDERRALLRYNPSSDYVEAVSRYARRLRADERTLYAFYARQVFYRGRRVTELP